LDTAGCVAVATCDVLLVSVAAAVGADVGSDVAVAVGADVGSGVAVAIGADIGSGVAVAIGADVGSGVAVAICGDVTVGVAELGSKGSATLLEVIVPPGAASFHLKSELCGIAPGFGLNRRLLSCVNVRFWPTLIGVPPSDSTTVPFVGSSVTCTVTEGDRASLGTAILSALPKTES
jgi:hypothetical protein